MLLLLFCVPSVDYLGYWVNQHGLQPLSKKVIAIQEAPAPTNVQEIRAFLGLLNYYGRFISQLSTITYPLNQLLKKGMKLGCSKECEGAFLMPKEKLTPEVLAHCDVNLHIKLDCDVSAYGIGAVFTYISR